MKNINDIYVDVVTGHLHVTMNELFKIKANYVLLEEEAKELHSNFEKVLMNLNEKNDIIAKQLLRIAELEEVNDTSSTSFKEAMEKLKIRCENAENESAALSKKASHIDTFSKQINMMNDELRKKDSEIGILNQEIKLLNERIHELTNPPQVPKKKTK